MSAVDWYFARGNKQSGPVSSVDLKRLADAGEVRPDDLVWREGLAEWALARNVRGLFDDDTTPVAVETAPVTAAMLLPQAEAGKSREPPAGPRAPSRHAVDFLLDRLRSAFSEPFIDTTAAIFRACGLYGLLIAMAVTLGFATLVAVQSNVQSGILSGASLILLLAALQYSAAKACGLLERLNRSIGSTLSSPVLPDCIAILSFAAAVSAVFTSIAVAMDQSLYFAVPVGIATFIVLVYLGIVALRPASVNVSIAGADKGGLGEEALAVLTFLVKCLMRVAPVAFGAGVMCATLALGYACYEAFAGEEFLSDALLTAAAARCGLVVFAALPLAAYLLVLLYGLVLDLCRAILASPGKAGKLTPSDPAEE